MRWGKKKTGSVLLAFVAVMAFLLLVAFSIPMHRDAQAFGKEAGRYLGNRVGKAAGSVAGVTKEYPKGWDKGKEDGLSAVDTAAEIRNHFHETARLEVLVSHFKLDNYHEVGDKYTAVYLMKANAVFTVDLSKASVTVGEDSALHVKIPDPEVEIYIDEKDIEKAAEYQRVFFNGSAEDGFDAYINSMSNLEEKTQRSIENDENMMENARESAKKQIQQLMEHIWVDHEVPFIVWE